MITIILRDPRLSPLLPQAVRCKSPLGCLLNALEVACLLHS